jgi:hypothetical protein
VSSLLIAVSLILNDETLFELLQDRVDLGRFQMSISSLDAMPGLHLASDTESDSNARSTSDGEALADLFAEAITLFWAPSGASFYNKLTVQEQFTQASMAVDPATKRQR